MERVDNFVDMSKKDMEKTGKRKYTFGGNTDGNMWKYLQNRKKVKIFTNEVIHSILKTCEKSHK